MCFNWQNIELTFSPFGCLEIKPTFHFAAFTLQIHCVEVHDNEFRHLRLFIRRLKTKLCNGGGAKLLTFKKQAQAKRRLFIVRKHLKCVFPPRLFSSSFLLALKSFLSAPFPEGSAAGRGWNSLLSCFDCVLSAQSVLLFIPQAAQFLWDATFFQTRQQMKWKALYRRWELLVPNSDKWYKPNRNLVLSRKGSSMILQDFETKCPQKILKWRTVFFFCFFILCHWIQCRQELCCTNVNLRQVII